MRGLLLASGTMSLCDDLPLPTARKGWSRVRVLQAGICATDQALDRGYMGFCGVPGHEFVGIALDGPLAG
ncbi:MAG: alcohol dehydrogenase, partial [Planctomycetota bacterium]